MKRWHQLRYKGTFVNKIMFKVSIFLNYFFYRGNLLRAAELFEKAINLTRNEESMLNLCSMLIGAQTQHKIVSKIALTGFR